MTTLCLSFQPMVWANSGPKALTRVMKTRCKIYLRDGKPQSCDNITIYPETFFSPVYFKKFKHYFDDGKGQNFENVSITALFF